MTGVPVLWLHRDQEDLMSDTKRLLWTAGDEANRALEGPEL